MHGPSFDWIVKFSGHATEISHKRLSIVPQMSFLELNTLLNHNSLDIEVKQTKSRGET